MLAAALACALTRGAAAAGVVPTGSGSASRVLAAFLALVGGFFVFVALALVCDDFLCPAIEAICEHFNVPEDIAGASLLALGSSAPEIVMNALGTMTGKIELSLPAVLASGLIGFGFVPPLCAAVAPAAGPSDGAWWRRRTMTLRTWPILRDSVAYVVVVTFLFISSADGEMSLGESGALVAAYVAYMAVVCGPHFAGYLCGPRGRANSYERVIAEADEAAAAPNPLRDEAKEAADDDDDDDDADVPDDEAAKSPLHSPSKIFKAAPKSPPHSPRSLRRFFQPLEVETPALDEEPERRGIGETAVAWASWPMGHALRFTVPFPAPETGWLSPAYVGCAEAKWRVWAGLGASLIWVGLLANAALWTAQDASLALGLSPALAGATLLAWGAQIPDVLGSVSMSRSGLADAAVANAAGSQVLNVAIGTGLPFFISTLVTGDAIVLGASASTALAVLGVVVLAVVLTWVAAAVLCGGGANCGTTGPGAPPPGKTALTAGGATGLFAVASTAYAIFIVVELVAPRV